MFENPEEAFKELDKKEYSFLAVSLGGYRQALMDQGFTRREALRLVEPFSKFLYDMALEEFCTDQRIREAESYRGMEGPEFGDVDSDTDE